MRLLSVFILCMLSLRAFAATAVAQEVELGEPAPLVVTPRVAAAAAAPPARPAALASGEEAWAEIIRTTVIAALPEKTVEDKDWGHKSSVFSRYEIKTRKGRLSMRPRTKEVNHGFWQRYTVTMLNPQETLQLEFDDIQRQPGGKTSFTMQMVMRARIEAEFEHWVYGVKGINGQTESDVTLAVVVNCAYDITTDQKEGELLPAFQIVPEVNSLDLKVRDIDTRKVGLIGGWAAEQLGDNSRSTVNSILNASEERILKDLRKKIEKNIERLRVSPSKLFGGKKDRANPPQAP